MTATWGEVISGVEQPATLAGIVDGGELRGAGVDPAVRLVWADDFNGPAGSPPDPARWVHDVGGGGWGNGELQGYTTSVANCALDGAGNLRITARQEPGPDGTAYTSARVTTLGRFEFVHGRVEARIQLPEPSQGVWPAFWLLGHPDVGWPHCGELDILEAVNDMSEIGFNWHQPATAGGLNRWQATVPAAAASGGSWAGGWHRYGVEWGPHHIVWLIDGVPVAQGRRQDRTGTQRWVLHTQPQHLILNVAVGGTYPGPPDGSTVLPVSMLVDWVRVYATPDTVVAVP